jgi:hypothetical protein
MTICREVIAQIEKNQETRSLSNGDRNLIKDLKSRILGLAFIEKCRARQRSRFTWLRMGDANTKLFHLMANARKRKNFIHSIQTGNGLAVSQAEKQQAVYNHFLNHTWTYVPRQWSLNLSELGWEPKQLNHLNLPFTEEEIKSVIISAPKEKAPGPDGYVGLFFSSCWNIIRMDLIQAVNQFYHMNQQGLQFLNQAFVVLIPKKENPQRVSDYMHISLTHSFAKIISKHLANRLAPELHHLISINQTTFIKSCCIHDNFVYVQQVVKDLQRKKIPSIFIKLDISKAFDTVSWPYYCRPRPTDGR